ncbi:MAG: 6-bladed beta-propeller [Candidatus Aminicenantes bacterium]|nr:MAG: 6-bladed beta-propeller [Candidatus Aminicenantes bacterium]
MKKILFCIFAATILIWFSCSKKREGGATIEVVDGIEHIHNTETPLYPERTVVFEEELSIRSEDAEGNIRLFRPSWHLVDGKGFIYICDLQDLQIKVFDPAGLLVRTIGQKGDGPGEFQNIGEIALLPDDRLLVLDWEAHRISMFDTEGKFVNSHKFINWSYDIFLTTSSSYVRDERIFGEKTKLVVKTCDFAGNEIFTYGDFEPRHSQDIKEAGQWFSVSVPYDVRSILAGDQKNSRLYHCMNDKYLIEVYDPNGKLFRKIDRPYKLLLTRSEDKKKYLAGFTRSSETSLALIDKHVQMPSVKTVTDNLVVDDSGNLWVETNEEKEEQGKIFTAFDIFNEDGVYEARVWLDISLGLFKNGKMYTKETNDETGYRVYKRYHVIWSE